jgi:hypothetical protein
MTTFCSGILIVWMTLPGIKNEDSIAGIDFCFSQRDSVYSFKGNFIVDGDPACLISIISEFSHISKYASGATSVELIREEENWSIVSYTYRRFLFLENRSTWRRTLYGDRQELVFEMISSENNIKIMPELRSSSGYYRISPAEEDYRMEYFQTCSLVPVFMNDLYLRRIKEEAIEFMQVFREYIIQNCP